MMRWMEQCAFIAASRVARGGFLLTAAMDSISFLNPTRVGDTVYVEGQVRGRGREGELNEADDVLPRHLRRSSARRLAPAHAHAGCETRQVLCPCSLASALTSRLHRALAPSIQVTAIFGSSVEVLISLWGETPDVGVMFHCGDAYATVVSGEH